MTRQPVTRQLVLGLGRHVRGRVAAFQERGLTRRVHGDSPGGDAQFDVDHVAERAVLEYLRARAGVPLAVYTEDGSLRELAPSPEYALVVDPIDGTRPTSAGLEMGMVSIAVAPLDGPTPTIADVTAAALIELKSGAWLYGDAEEGLVSGGYPYSPPRLSRTDDPAAMFWSIELNGHPMRLMSAAYADLVDRSANSGGVFVFNSASFSISRIITGQLDAYVDIGNRVLRDHPSTEDDFLRAGRGSILHLFPYDIAASVHLARLAGVVITDAYGRDLGETRLFDLDPMNQRSCVAASNPLLHERVLNSIHWDLPGVTGTPLRERP